MARERILFVWTYGNEYPRIRIADKNTRYWKREDGIFRHKRRATPEEEKAYWNLTLDVTRVQFNAKG